jgi:hypothetical protein
MLSEYDHWQWTNFKEPSTKVTLDLIQVYFFWAKATTFTKDMMDYGTRVVAGVTPGKYGQQVHGVPVFDTVRQALKEQPAEASVISVPPTLVKGAVLEALDNGIQLLVVVSERVPRKGRTQHSGIDISPSIETGYGRGSGRGRQESLLAGNGWHCFKKRGDDN